MISFKYSRILVRIIAFGLLCAFFGYVFTLIEKGILGELNYYPVTGNPYRFEDAVIITTLSSFILGLFFGVIEVFILEKMFRKVPFLVKLILKTGLYIFFISLFFNIVTLLNSSFTRGLSVMHPEVINSSRLFFTNSLFIAVLLYAGGIIAIILFLFEINDNLGQGIVINFLIGKYHYPRQENRIFLFLDMKSSTTIAENIGHTNYFEFLKAYYADMTKSIEKYSGKIYQYVGDEIVITWNLKSGFKNNNCLNCFLSIKKTFKQLKGKYENKFGIVPKFKAGIHMGSVATGEIGVLKKEILFSGDVLNTTSRMESLCNTYDVECIISENLLSNLKPDSNLDIKIIGVCKLRGKNKDVKLFSVTEKAYS